MKFSLFSILLAFGAFQVDFVLSTVQSRIQELNNLWREANAITDGLNDFKNKKIDFASDTIFNETILSLDQVTNLTLIVQKQIEDEADTYVAEDELIDVDSCLKSALNALKQIIVSDCGAFGGCHNYSIVEIKTIVVELTEYIKIVDTIKKEIIYVRDQACKYFTGYLKELCLYCRIPQFEVTIVSHTKKVERFKKRTIKYIEQIIQQVSSCLVESNNKAEDKLHQISKDVTECFNQLCNATSTTPEYNLI